MLMLLQYVNKRVYEQLARLPYRYGAMETITRSYYSSMKYADSGSLFR